MDFPPLKEITNNQEYGKIIPVDDVEALSIELIKASRKKYENNFFYEIIEYAKRNYSWDVIGMKLFEVLNDNYHGDKL